MLQVTLGRRSLPKEQIHEKKLEFSFAQTTPRGPGQGVDPSFMWGGCSRAFSSSGEISTPLITQTHSWGKRSYSRGVKLELALAGTIPFYQREERDGSCFCPICGDLFTCDTSLLELLFPKS